MHSNSLTSKYSLGIRGKLLLGFAITTLFLLIAISIILVITSKTEKNSVIVNNVTLPAYDALIDMNTDLSSVRIYSLRWAITQKSEFKDELEKSWRRLERTKTLIDNSVKNWGSSEKLKDWEEVKSLLSQLKSAQLNLINLPASANNETIKKAVEVIIPIASKVSTLLNVIDEDNTTASGILDVQSKDLHLSMKAIEDDLSNIRIISYVLLVLSVIASVFISIITARKILSPIYYAINISKKIALGQRNINIKITATDETAELLTALNEMQTAIKDSESKLKNTESTTHDMFDRVVKSAQLFSEYSSKVASGDLREHLKLSHDKNDQKAMLQLGEDLNKMTENLSVITKEIIQACHSMVSTLEEVKSSVDAQSTGATEQASSVNEITSSITEIEKSATQTMEKAKYLGEVAERTREKGQLGLDSVEQSVQGMKSVRDKVQLIAQTILDLSNQTQQVGEITAVVNNLAQQSKMLALNASIEAAKAGEAGKGFSVVAVEVKNLAEQSEQSTAQVQKILEDIKRATEKAVMVTEEGTKGVDQGTELIGKTGDVIRSLNDVIHEATIASQQIEAAVRQESAGIEQITAGMNEINQVTTSFVESVKTTTSALDNLSLIAKNLKSYVDTYKI